MESKNYEDLLKIYAEQEETLKQLDLKLNGVDEGYRKTLAELENVQREADEYRLLQDQTKGHLIEETQSAFHLIKEYDRIEDQVKETLNYMNESEETVKKRHITLLEVMQDQIKSIEKLNETMIPENMAKMNAGHLEKLEENAIALENVEEELKAIKYDVNPNYKAPQCNIFRGSDNPLKKLDEINIILKKSQEIMTALETERKDRKSRLLK